MLEITVLVTVVLVIVFAALFGTPAVIAKKRKHRQYPAIVALCVVAFIVSIFSIQIAGIMWVAALIWSLTTPAVVIQGPKGDTGAKGETGPRGYTGQKGDAGKDAIPMSKAGNLYTQLHNGGNVNV